jgi:hypothetical protein
LKAVGIRQSAGRRYGAFLHFLPPLFALVVAMTVEFGYLQSDPRRSLCLSGAVSEFTAVHNTA